MRPVFKAHSTGNSHSDFEVKLASAHSRIEKSFLDGGAVLVSVMDNLGSLVDSLDQLTGVLDGKTTTDTVQGLRKTVSDLALLPARASARQDSFSQISDQCASTYSHVEEMRETIRYLRTFAITVKITGAGLAEFSGFADEIRERIQSGAEEIDRFAEQLAGMRGQLDTARAFSDGILSDFSNTIPTIVSSLTLSSDQLATQHKTMAGIANDVKGLTRAIQGKIANVLSALQIGDITRQRIEHIQSSLDYLEEFFAAGGLRDPAEKEVLRQAVLHLAHAQLQESLDDFRQKCTSIAANMSSFTSDAARVLALRDELNQSGGDNDRSLLRKMESDISHACALSARVQDRSHESDAVVSSVTQSAQALQEGIETIRSIKTDIHYMALNSNLRCSRLGDAGRSVNVVSGELRTFAAKLETPADAIVEDMRCVEEATASLTRDDNDDINHIHEPLNLALDKIRVVATDMEKGLEAFGAEGQLVFSRISAAVTKLDFDGELGGLLLDCLAIADRARGHMPSLSAIPAAALPLSQKIFAIYTMAQERDIHQRFLPLQAGFDMVVDQAEVFEDDEQLFAGALF
ncbi:chemotaxis protein [Agrobacterium vitis]|uniref:chemotaxis protein n=1 Tax=Agrobacterium vitis TaxID=373 RepID=UPI00137D6EC5|nr:chemotaxis protein [Agrobacterium vitis]MVA72286.1 chemotaxis protein [Agrobacterium vitis]